MPEFRVFLTGDTSRERPAPVIQRRQVGSRLRVEQQVIKDTLFGILGNPTASRVLGTDPIYMNVDVSRRITAMLQSMGGLADQGCAEAANATAKRVAARFTGIAKRDLNTDGSYAERAIGVSKEATTSNPTAVVTVKEERIPLIAFGAYETSTGVSAVTDRKRGVKSVTDGFIATGRTGQTAFKRETSRRYPLDELYGPSVKDFVSDRLKSHQGWIEAVLFEELQNATNRLVNQNYGLDTLGPLLARII
jgi:hypothetical protein